MSNKKNKNILVIDDDLCTVSVLTKLLNEHNYNVISANSATEGLKKLSDNIDIIFLDLNMPKMSGLGFLIEMKKHVSKRIPVIIFSAETDEEIKKYTMELGAYKYIEKLLPNDIFIDTINSAL